MKAKITTATIHVFMLVLACFRMSIDDDELSDARSKAHRRCTLQYVITSLLVCSNLVLLWSRFLRRKRSALEEPLGGTIDNERHVA